MKKRIEKQLVKIVASRENFYWRLYLECLKSGDIQKANDCLLLRGAYKTCLDCIEYAINNNSDCLAQFEIEE